jgi:hypothetical protein
MSFHQFLEKWRMAREALCRHRQLVDPGSLIDDILKDAVDAFHGDQDEFLDVQRAAEESGYHPDHLAPVWFARGRSRTAVPQGTAAAS